MRRYKDLGLIAIYKFIWISKIKEVKEREDGRDTERTHAYCPSDGEKRTLKWRKARECWKSEKEPRRGSSVADVCNKWKEQSMKEPSFEFSRDRRFS